MININIAHRDAKTLLTILNNAIHCSHFEYDTFDQDRASRIYDNLIKALNDNPTCNIESALSKAALTNAVVTKAPLDKDEYCAYLDGWYDALRFIKDEMGIV